MKGRIIQNYNICIKKSVYLARRLVNRLNTEDGIVVHKGKTHRNLAKVDSKRHAGKNTGTVKRVPSTGKHK